MGEIRGAVEGYGDSALKEVAHVVSSIGLRLYDSVYMCYDCLYMYGCLYVLMFSEYLCTCTMLHTLSITACRIYTCSM